MVVRVSSQVFMRVGEGRDHHFQLQQAKFTTAAAAGSTPEAATTTTRVTTTSPASSTDDSLSLLGHEDIESHQSSPLLWAHLKALLHKRWIYARRDKKSQCFQLVVPALLVLLGLALLKLLGNPLVQPDLLLTPTMMNPHYPENERAFVPVLLEDPSNEWGRKVVEVLDGSNGVGRAVVVEEPQADQFGGCIDVSSSSSSSSNSSNSSGGGGGGGIRCL